LPSLFVSGGISVAGDWPEGAHAGPAEKPLGDEQLPFWWNATRYSPIGRLVPDTITVIPSLRSTTRTLPDTAEPSPRNGATRPGEGPLDASLSFDWNIERDDSQPISAPAIAGINQAAFHPHRKACMRLINGKRARRSPDQTLAITPHATRAPELPVGCVL
jgi:hypothetical protein